MTLLRYAALPLLALLPSMASAQSANGANAPAGYASINAPCSMAADGKCYAIGYAVPMPTAGKQEALALATGNIAAAPTSAYGGRYVFAATCSTWVANGITLQVRGPDGVTFLPAGQYSANTAVEVGVGTAAVVQAVVAPGSAGCNAVLSREP